VTASIDLPAGSPYFAGHFPGRPILPGVTALHLAIAAIARDAGVPPTIAVLHSARLKRLIVPGDRVEAAARSSTPGRHRIELRVGDAVAAQADVTLGAPAVLDEANDLAPIEGAPPAGLPALDALMPHRPPMRFPTDVLASSDAGLAARAAIPAGCPLVTAGRASAIACVEAAAQAAALWEAVRRFAGPAAEQGPRVGYLVALRDLVFGVADMPADTPFDVAVRLDAVALPLTHYAIEARLGDRVLVRGRVATVLAPDA
jgi:predicted hotdog family 3-hydroxylacyl-ACP dehydratase